ncbi:MAG: HPF/RaiA family ribosome-associated protein [Chitinophagaceae bacterium]
MKIQINTDNNIHIDQDMASDFSQLIEREFSRFTGITRVEVHLTDENAAKSGQNDIRCMIEARLEGKQPVAATSHANSKEQALNGAIDKIMAALETITGKMAKHQQ